VFVQIELKGILGVVNLFDESMAVGYYELDLSLEEQRFVCQVMMGGIPQKFSIFIS